MDLSNKITSKRSKVLSERLLKGANALVEFAEGLSDEKWKTPVAGDGRSIGVVVHHVASVYPIEIELAQVLASGNPITGATMEVIDKMNEDHAIEFKDVTTQETIELLKKNSTSAANSIREFTDANLESAAPVSLYYDAPLTAQFFIEDHALRHSYHHLAKIKASL